MGERRCPGLAIEARQISAATLGLGLRGCSLEQGQRQASLAER
jgi:hypothetical protein